MLNVTKRNNNYMTFFHKTILQQRFCFISVQMWSVEFCRWRNNFRNIV